MIIVKNELIGVFSSRKLMRNGFGSVHIDLTFTYLQLTTEGFDLNYLLFKRCLMMSEFEGAVQPSVFHMSMHGCVVLDLNFDMAIEKIS